MIMKACFLMTYIMEMVVNVHLCLIMTSGPQPDLLLYPNLILIFVLIFLMKLEFTVTWCLDLCVSCSHSCCFDLTVSIH